VVRGIDREGGVGTGAGVAAEAAMSVPVDTLDELRQHLAPVLAGRAGPDAGQVGPAVLTLLGALLWREDPGPVEVRAPGLAWVSLSGERYLLRHDPRARRAEVRRGLGIGQATRRYFPIYSYRPAPFPRPRTLVARRGSVPDFPIHG
jgi:hypothetical protein